MNNTRFTIPCAVLCLSLAACGQQTQKTSIENENMNPLTASRYGDELADTMANLVIQKDPLSLKADTRAVIDQKISMGKKLGEDARKLQAEGMMGQIIQIKEEVSGYVLYLNDMLFLSSDFLTKPGPNLHVYLTQTVDPRDGTFPDKTAIDLGAVQNIYGAQTYAVPHQEDPKLYRTFVLWDKTFSRLYGFAQLAKGQ